MYLDVIRQLSIMVMIAVAGFCVTKAFKFGKGEQMFMSKILLYVINPCMILVTFDVPYDSLKLREMGLEICFALAAHFILTCIALLFCRSRNASFRDWDSIDRLGVVFTNSAFIGIPLISGVFGSEGVFYLMGYIAVFNLWIWTFGYSMMGGKINLLKVLRNPNIIAVVAGLVLFCIPGEIPGVLKTPLKYVGDMNTATSMLLLGMLFATFSVPSRKGSDGSGMVGVYVARVLKLAVLRLVVPAAVMMLAAWGFVSLFSGMEHIRLMAYVVFIASLCPVGMMVSSFAVLFGKDESYASLLVSVTSALCIITLPVSIAIAEHIF